MTDSMPSINDLDEDSLQAALENYRNNSRVAIPRGMSSAYEAALVTSVIITYERVKAGLSAVTAEEFDTVLSENIEKVLAARDNWGPLI